MATPPPKLKVTIDTDSAGIDRVLTALGRAENNPDTVALTGQDVAVSVLGRYQPATIVLSRPHPTLGKMKSPF
jgi:hypothetical protein